MAKEMKAAVCTFKRLTQFTRKSSPQLVRTVQATSFIDVEHPLVIWLSRTWDPTGSKFACWILDNKTFAANIAVSCMNLLQYFIYVPGKMGSQTVLAIELYVQWDPRIIENVLMDAIFVQLDQKSVDLLVLYIQVI
jgi:hypothetical protein